MEDAVDSITNAQLILGRLKMDVCGAILKGFPDDLVHELDHTGFLIPLGYFLVFADDKLDGLILFQFI